MEVPKRSKGVKKAQEFLEFLEKSRKLSFAYEEEMNKFSFIYIRRRASITSNDIDKFRFVFHNFPHPSLFFSVCVTDPNIIICEKFDLFVLWFRIPLARSLGVLCEAQHIHSDSRAHLTWRICENSIFHTLISCGMFAQLIRSLFRVSQKSHISKARRLVMFEDLKITLQFFSFCAWRSCKPSKQTCEKLRKFSHKDKIKRFLEFQFHFVASSVFFPQFFSCTISIFTKKNRSFSVFPLPTLAPLCCRLFTTQNLLVAFRYFSILPLAHTSLLYLLLASHLLPPVTRSASTSSHVFASSFNMLDFLSGREFFHLAVKFCA